MFKRKQNIYRCTRCGRDYINHIPFSKCACGNEMLNNYTGEIGYIKIEMVKDLFGEWREINK